MADVGLLVLRLVVGLYLFGHGAQKLFGWWGGPGLSGTHGFMGMLGFRPAPFWTAAMLAGEVGGGLLLTLGFLSPLGALGVAAAMVVATIGVHWDKGIWQANGGFELSLTYLAGAVALGLTGPGRFSLDALLGTALPAGLAEVAAALAVIAVLAALLGRRPALAQQTAAADAHS